MNIKTKADLIYHWRELYRAPARQAIESPGKLQRPDLEELIACGALST